MTDEDRHLIERIWRRVPVRTRRQFWAKTGYGTRDPSEQLKATLVAAALSATTDECTVVMAADAEVRAMNAEMTDLHELCARLPVLVKIRRDLEYRTPENGMPLANIVLTREQAIELLTFCREASGATHAQP
jgi:hypothetical protein